jgi:hypothetical protein
MHHVLLHLFTTVVTHHKRRKRGRFLSRYAVITSIKTLALFSIVQQIPIFSKKMPDGNQTAEHRRVKCLAVSIYKSYIN